MALKDLFKKKQEKSVPAAGAISEETRDGQYKAFIPEFLYKPPYGYPRFTNIPTIRQLANTPVVDMCISTIISEIIALDWNIVSTEEGDPSEQKKKQIKEVKHFFENPNTNKESFKNILKKILRDILEIDSGVINKVFNQKGQMVEIVARDGATFTKNPDMFGMFTQREDLIMTDQIVENAERGNPRSSISADNAREQAAYFQYGWITGSIPIPFGKREIVWFEQNPRTDQVYGRSKIETLENTLKTLVYAIESNLEYYNDNSIPKGIIGLEDSNTEELEAFANAFRNQQKKKDNFGGYKQDKHNVPITNKKPYFERVQFSNAELELIQQQEWFSKMVWAVFGVTPSELGYTESSNKATEIIQSDVFKRKAINPLIELLEYTINHEIIPEFEYEDIKFKFNTFDIENEKKKSELYSEQVRTWKTPNEIRMEEGKEPLEMGGDSILAKEGDNQGNQEQETKSLKKKIEGKPFAGYENFDQCVRDNQDKKDPEAYCAEIHKEATGKYPGKKALETTQDSDRNPLVLDENEVPNPQKLDKALKYLLRQYEEKIKQKINVEIGREQININQKGLGDVMDYVKGLIGFESARTVADQVLKQQFQKGWENSEKKLNRNFLPDQDAVRYIQNYTFQNIKDMDEEIVNDIRAELQRGLMNGEGVDKLNKRIGKIFKSAEDRVEAITRTETTRASNMGSMQAMKQSGEKVKKKWVAHIDERTSGICSRLHNQEVYINENFKDPQTEEEYQSPPSHVNCRSSLVYEVE